MTGITAVHGAASTTPSVVNVTHLELFANFTAALWVPEVDDDLCSTVTRCAIKASLKTPYLLHAILALSARHLSATRPEQKAFYLAQATELQNQAIAMFNASIGLPLRQVGPENAVTMLLFSSCMARHSLVDVLAAAPQCDDLDAFLDLYTNHCQLQRGVSTIFLKYQHFIQESELRPLSDWSNLAFSSAGGGPQTSSIRRLLASSPNLSSKEIQVCEEALSFLQVALAQVNATSIAPGERSGWRHIAFNWNLLAPAAYGELLSRRVPEAIVVLSYYFVLLHYDRGSWQVGDVGQRLLDLAMQYLGNEWEPWLAWPLAAVARGSSSLGRGTP
jgi:hypothetical protein